MFSAKEWQFLTGACPEIFGSKGGGVYVTDNDKRQQKAMLLLEFQEADENFKHIKEKLDRMHSAFSSIAQWVKEGAYKYPAFSQMDAKMRANADRYEKVTFADALAALDEFAAAAAHLEELRKRKENLGLK